MQHPAIRIPLHGPFSSSALELYLNRMSETPSSSDETDLLSSIRNALRGSDTESTSAVQSSSFCYEGEPWQEDELTWNARTVILSSGGVMRKKWDFVEEGQSIQWACIGWLEHNTPSSASSHGTAYTSAPPPDSAERPTFGPFAQVRQDAMPTSGNAARVSSVFVFLRSIGKIFLTNGLQYTFSLPFIVRKAWPLSPHGVMIQRVLEPTEMEEAEVTGDAVLPTIFSITSPFSEAGTVGLTTGIVGGFRDTLPSLKDEDENSTKPLKSVVPTEMVVWTSHRGPASCDDVLVTIDVSQRQLSIWRYAYIKPKDTPVPLGRASTRNTTKKRHSTTGVGNHRSPVSYHDVAKRRPQSPDIYSRESLPMPELPEVPEALPLHSLPRMAPTLSTTTTMAALVTGGQSQLSAPMKGRRNSLARGNDLSVTMDRMVLGGRLDNDLALAPIEHGRMKAAYWMERIYAKQISITE
jgi:anaphase-promoting complex subunit 1